MAVLHVVADLCGCADAQAVDDFWFKPNRGKTIRERFGIDPDVFWDAFGKYDNAERRNPFTKVYPDVIPVLQRLNTMGKTISIITGAPRWVAEMEVAKLEGISIAHVLALNGSPFSEKPCPDGMKHVLSQLGHKPEETLYIGNSTEDAMFAEAAGCGFRLVDRKEYAFDDQFAQHLISSLNELFHPVNQ